MMQIPLCAGCRRALKACRAQASILSCHKHIVNVMLMRGQITWQSESKAAGSPVSSCPAGNGRTSQLLEAASWAWSVLST